MYVRLPGGHIHGAEQTQKNPHTDPQGHITKGNQPYKTQYNLVCIELFLNIQHQKIVKWQVESLNLTLLSRFPHCFQPTCILYLSCLILL